MPQQTCSGLLYVSFRRSCDILEKGQVLKANRPGFPFMTWFRPRVCPVLTAARSVRSTQSWQPTALRVPGLLKAGLSPLPESSRYWPLGTEGPGNAPSPLSPSWCFATFLRLLRRSCKPSVVATCEFTCILILICHFLPASHPGPRYHPEDYIQICYLYTTGYSSQALTSGELK